MKKLFACLMAGALLTGCAAESNDTETGTEGSTTEKEVITVWAWDKNFNIPVMEEAAKVYEAAHENVDIEIVDYAREDIETKLHTTLSTGSTKNLPDIVLVEDYAAQKFLTSYPGMFADLTGKIDHDSFAPYKVAPMTVDNAIYGVPFDSGIAAMFYRTDILEEAGYTAEDLQDITWDEYLTIGADVYEKTGKYIMGENLNEMSGIIRIMLQSAGSWYFDETGQVTITDNEAMIEAFEIIKEMKDSQTVVNTNGWDAWVGAMNDGSVASVVTGAWIMGSITAAPDQSGLWAVAPLPRLSTVDSVNASNLGGSSWYVLADKETNETAIDFLDETFGAHEEFYQTILTNVGAIGTYIPAQDGAAYGEPSEFFSNQTIYKDFSTWMQAVPEVNYGVYVGEADQAVHSVMPAFMAGDLTVEEALQQVEDTINNQIK